MKPMYRTMTRVLPAFFLLALFLIVWPAAPMGGQDQFTFQSPIHTGRAPTPGLFSSPLPTPPVPAPAPIADDVQLALRYAIDQLGISASQLLVDHHYRQDYPELGRSFTAVTLLDIGRDRFFTLLVDLKDHSIEADMKALEDAEAQARRAKYGKLEPALHARLQHTSDDELVDVAIWIAGKPVRDQRERYQALATQFPQAGESLEHYGTPFYQADPALSTAIQQAYEDMLREDVQALLQPLITYLRSLNYTPLTVPGLPAVMVKLPKRAIVELSQRSDVGRIFLTERPAGPALDVAVPSGRIPSLWQKQVGGLPLDGEGGTRIGIVEGGTADIYSRAGLCAASPCFRHPGGVSGGFGDDWNYQHATLVASAAASDYAPRRGAAPGATV